MLDEYERELVNELMIELNSMRDSYVMAMSSTTDKAQATYLHVANRSHERATVIAGLLKKKPEPAPISPTGCRPGSESNDIVGAIGSLPGF